MKMLVIAMEKWKVLRKTIRIWAQKFMNRSKKMTRTACVILRRLYGMAAAHRESIGYYTVLTLVLVALGAAANDYRSRKLEQQLAAALPSVDPGISVQTKPDQTLPPEEPAADFIAPVQGPIVGVFADDTLTWSTTLQLWQTHPAIDIAASAGEAVVAAADGTVVEAYSDSLYGNVIAIEHTDGSLLRYCSLNTLNLVSVGQSVRQGDIISAVGTCSAESELGAHIHLEYCAGQSPSDFSLLIDAE